MMTDLSSPKMSHVCLSILQYLSLMDTCHQLQEENGRLSHKCTKLEQQIGMLEQQAALSNRQVCAFNQLTAYIHIFSF